MGPPIGCTWCSYETRAGNGVIPRATYASVVVTTPKGERELCDKHAASGKWDERDRRVSAVA